MIRLSLILPLLVATPASADGLRAGAAAVKITPPVGTPMAGYYHARAVEAVHDDLYAKALVIEKDGTRAALVALDLISTTRELVEAARREIEKTTGVRGDAVMLSATHAHTGPVLRSGSARDGIMGVGSDLGRAYSDELPAKIAEVVRIAEAALDAGEPLGRARAGSVHRIQSTVPHERRLRGLEPRQAQPADPQAGRDDRPRRAGRLRRVGRSQAAGDLHQLCGPPRQRRRRADLGRHAGDARAVPGRIQGAGDGHALHGRVLRRYQSYRRELGREAERVRQRGADGDHPRGRGPADVAPAGAGERRRLEDKERDGPPRSRANRAG